jgi:hypothetical protein
MGLNEFITSIQTVRRQIYFIGIRLSLFVQVGFGFLASYLKNCSFIGNLILTVSFRDPRTSSVTVSELNGQIPMYYKLATIFEGVRACSHTFLKRHTQG